jgi:hypothetical protein
VHGAREKAREGAKHVKQRKAVRERRAMAGVVERHAVHAMVVGGRATHGRKDQQWDDDLWAREVVDADAGSVRSEAEERCGSAGGDESRGGQKPQTEEASSAFYAQLMADQMVLDKVDPTASRTLMTREEAREETRLVVVEERILYSYCTHTVLIL